MYCTPFKQAGLIEIIEDYNAQYDQDFSLANHSKFKKDLAARLAHKKPYLRIGQTPAQQLDLLIVVDQMLTGFDSKWLNTLYLDKVLRYENIIQAFSRTNRLYLENEKPFGTIRYYRTPHSMARNIEEAVKLYSGDKPLGLFVDKLESNLKKINASFEEIAELFADAGIENFEKLPADTSVCGQFVKLFKGLNDSLDAAKIQGFVWSKGKPKTQVTPGFDETTYLTLALRYKELARGDGGGGAGANDVPFDISGHLTEIDTGKIDADYMNSRFEKYLTTVKQGDADSEAIQKTVNELHKSFATLTQEQQKVANLFLNDVQRGNVIPEAGKTFRQYITEYQASAKNAQIANITALLGLNESKLVALMNTGVTATNINEFGRFDALKNSVDNAKAKVYFEKQAGATVSPFQVNIKIDTLLEDFIVGGGFDLREVKS